MGGGPPYLNRCILARRRLEETETKFSASVLMLLLLLLDSSVAGAASAARVDSISRMEAKKNTTILFMMLLPERSETLWFPKQPRPADFIPPSKLQEEDGCKNNLPRNSLPPCFARKCRAGFFAAC